MVHLGKIPTDKEINTPVVEGLEQIKLEEPSEDEITTSVYGSRFAAQDLPRYEMPEKEMPKEIAYRMIKDDLTLDGTPTLNLASFVTTYMVDTRTVLPSMIPEEADMFQEDEAEKLMVDAFSKNFIDYEEYPVSADIQNRCVSMIARLFNIPAHDENTNAMGTSTIGSSEAIMLGTLAMKKRWQNKRKAAGKPYDKPNIVMNSAVQVCWEKAARYFEVEEKYVYCTKDRYVIDPEEAVNLVDENTIGICSILGTTYTGEYEDTKKINDLLVERNIDCPIHGVGWVVWRDPEFLPKELIFNINYLGADQASFTLNFSRGASQVIGQYYQLIRLGKHGYRSIML
ncbi:hypothetical protein LTR16_000574 [Cryomyces antarcticus]|uniref:glutamate decarboxylase n=1 Tax=Cryomyces antarcticus TaxID=329879 RepID=A0ABR0M055_9PEZI|nr:hypothetical protein LTR16_000574 [Cryomyces antarcticus]